MTMAGAVGRGASMVGTWAGTWAIWLDGPATAARVAHPPKVAVTDAVAINALSPCRFFCATIAFCFDDNCELVTVTLFVFLLAFFATTRVAWRNGISAAIAAFA